MASKKISDYTPISGGGFDNDDLFDVSEHLGDGVYETRSITGAEIKASTGGSAVFTIDLTDALTVTFYAPSDLTIDSTDNIVNSPITTILVRGLAYTLGTSITKGDDINVTVSTNAVVNLITY